MPGTLNQGCQGTSCDGLGIPCAVDLGGVNSCTVITYPTNTGTNTPPPPTANEAAAHCPTAPTSAINTNPATRGYPGLATWLWARTPPNAAGTGTVRGHPVWCLLTPTRWTWTTDGHTTTTRAPGGPAPHHLLDHTYETADDHPITLTVTWTATTSAGTPSPNLATQTTTTHLTYPVREIRSIMTTD